MRTASYKRTDGSTMEIEYDENAPCLSCGLPVISASMGGPAICPWCDCGVYRDGEKWGIEDATFVAVRKRRAQEKHAANVH